MEQEVRQHGAVLTSAAGKGHRLLITDTEAFSVWHQAVTEVTEAVPDTMQDRVDFLLHRLLYADGYVKLDDLADELFIFRTTMTAVMKQVKYVLHLHLLTVAQRPGDGICVEGSEYDIRNCMVYDKLRQDRVTGNQDWNDDPMRQIMDSIALAFKQYDLSLAKQNFLSLLFYVSIAMLRLRSGHPLCFR